MLPAALTAKAIQLCAAMVGPAQPISTGSFPVAVISGATLLREPQNLADAEATVRDLLALRADFTAGPLQIAGRHFTTFGVTPSTVFDPCSLARVGDGGRGSPLAGTESVSDVVSLLRKAFGARVTDTIRPANATYGARYSWHKVGQAVDFVPAGGVGTIDRCRIRALMAQHGIRIIELLGPGDQGHSNHWHVAFARPGQTIDRTQHIEDGEDWFLDVARNGSGQQPAGTRQLDAVPEGSVAEPRPAAWDVFATTGPRSLQGGG